MRCTVTATSSPTGNGRALDPGVDDAAQPRRAPTMLGDEERAMYLEAAADYAPESSGGERRRLAVGRKDGTASTLPADTASAIRAQVRETTPAMVLDEARDAIETHLRTLRASIRTGESLRAHRCVEMSPYRNGLGVR